MKVKLLPVTITATFIAFIYSIYFYSNSALQNSLQSREPTDSSVSSDFLANNKNSRNSEISSHQLNAEMHNAPKTDSLYETPQEFYKTMQARTSGWIEERGYHLTESFNDYAGVDSYSGSHPYGYLSEDQIKALAENNDVDAQFLYAKYYLRDEPEEAFKMFQEIVVNTGQTAPLAEIGIKMMVDIRTKEQVADEGSEIETHEAENDAYAYFLLMKNRKDVTGDSLLRVMEYGQLDDARKIEIEKRTAALEKEFMEKRSQRGLSSYQDSALDIPQLMGITAEEYEQLKNKFYFSGYGINDF